MMTSGSSLSVGSVARWSASAWAAAVRVRLQLPAPSIRSGSVAPQLEPFDLRWLMVAVKRSLVASSSNVWISAGRLRVSTNRGSTRLSRICGPPTVATVSDR